MIIYANEHRGRYPDDLGILVANNYLPLEFVFSPRLGELDLPTRDQIGDAQQIRTWVNDYTHYVYLGKGLTVTSPVYSIVAHENPDLMTEGINCLFSDGHVEFLRMDEALARIAESRAKLPK
jgi:prepilin-type processing-associated H-X9-DG protein